MPAKHISQSDARWYKKRAVEAERTLQNQRLRWSSEFRPGWINVQTLRLDDCSYARLATTRLLGHAIVVTTDDDNTIRFYADKL